MRYDYQVLSISSYYKELRKEHIKTYSNTLKSLVSLSVLKLASCLLLPSINKPNFRFPFPMFDHPSYLKKNSKNFKKLVTYKVLFMIYYLIKTKVLITNFFNKTQSQIL
uniref:Uncharacterized protein n=1 Tax=Oryza brachyantha TaxID=4533 RepID=J3MUS8_ORYBR